MIVVSDTSPINYLVLIGHVQVLHSLFDQVFIPDAVYRELQNPGTPPKVISWMAVPPAWLSRKSVTSTLQGEAFERLGVLGILEAAAEHGLIDLPRAIDLLHKHLSTSNRQF